MAASIHNSMISRLALSAYKLSVLSRSISFSMSIRCPPLLAVGAISKSLSACQDKRPQPRGFLRPRPTATSSVPMPVPRRSWPGFYLRLSCVLLSLRRAGPCFTHPLLVLLIKAKAASSDIPTEQQDLCPNEAALHSEIVVIFPVAPKEVWAPRLAAWNNCHLDLEWVSDFCLCRLQKAVGQKRPLDDLCAHDCTSGGRRVTFSNFRLSIPSVVSAQWAGYLAATPSMSYKGSVRPTLSSNPGYAHTISRYHPTWNAGAQLSGLTLWLPYRTAYTKNLSAATVSPALRGMPCLSTNPQVSGSFGGVRVGAVAIALCTQSLYMTGSGHLLISACRAFASIGRTAIFQRLQFFQSDLHGLVRHGGAAVTAKIQEVIRALLATL